MKSIFMVLGVCVAMIPILFILSLFLVGIPVGTYTGYQWNKNVESYFILSDKSSTADKKLDYLNQYISKLEEKGLQEGESALIFKKPITDLSKQYEILLTLRTRLQELNSMSPTSLEYQQSLRQITDNEYPYLNTCVFPDGYNLRRGIFYWFYAGNGSCQDGNNKTSSDN